RGGATLSSVLNCIEKAKRSVNPPIVLFSYFNPLLRFGPKPLAERARAAGVDAILVTDLIPEEAEGRSWEETLMSQQLAPIYLVAPTTSESRLRLIAKRTRGFLYAVSRAGVTGARSEMARDAQSLVERVRKVSDVPVAVGFGISTSEQVREVWRYADGAVVGSAIVQKIEERSGNADLVRQVGDFTRSLLATAPAGDAHFVS
ncbi:MAG: tryptophan synthase subunit alpha, partial [Rhodanobacteraceae bacterium]